MTAADRVSLAPFSRPCAVGAMKIRVCRASEVPIGGMKPVEIGEHALLVARVGERYLAVGDVCTHARARLSDGYLDQHRCTVECHVHGAVFSLQTGAALEYPAEEPLPTYPVVLEDDDVYVVLPDPQSRPGDP